MGGGGRLVTGANLGARAGLEEKQPIVRENPFGLAS